MPNTRRPSLTLQLLVGIAAPFLMVIGLIGIIAYLSAQDEISEVYDSQLISAAQQLAIIARNDGSAGDMRIRRYDPHLATGDQAALDDYARWRTYRVWRKGQLLLASEGGPSGLTPHLPTGFSQLKTAAGGWRIFTFRAPESDLTVAVTESLAARREVSIRVVWGLCLPLLLVLPIILLMVWLGIRFGLKDLTRFAADVRRRSPDDLSRVDHDTLPAEIAPVAESVNQVLDKLERSLAQERLFTDNAAHELRTPLAALVVQMDVLRNATNDAEREPMLDDLSQGVNRAARLLDQLLILARVRHTPVQPVPVNLYQAAGDVIRDHYAKAKAKTIELSLNGDEEASPLSNRPLLAILIGNLVDNAIKYAPNGSSIELTVAATPEGASLVVCDQGPGIPENERTQVFTRFYRLKGRTESGSGLGLAIVKTLGDLLGANIVLFTPAGGVGLGVKVEFTI
ncbi:ATP-binding protein [Asticcacaulis sp. AC466]|uniref:ATP-binding protein n=1 Tax=Asticcacaulis sp. AC466 TaxID=1282362 RepID=UPI00040DF9D1|nr:ATP-binding protein [Asticcacaulis sp. AC466]